MDPVERRRIVSDYVTDRLVRECRGTWGKAMDVSRKTGFSTAHITNVMKRNRACGDDFATAMAKYWGITYVDLEKLAVERAAAAYSLDKANGAPSAESSVVSVGQPATLPDLHSCLTEALGYCRARGVYPAPYLDEYELEARRMPEDRPRDVWMADLRVKFWEWQQNAMRSHQGDRSETAHRTAARAEPAEKSEASGRASRRSTAHGKQSKEAVEPPANTGVRSRGGAHGADRAAKGR